MDIKQIQTLRRVFLLKLYDMTGGSRWNSPIMFEVGNAIGIEDSITEMIVDYLVQKGFVEYETKERDISITVNGVDEAESYLENENFAISSTDLNLKLNEINNKLDLLSLGHELIYDEIISKLDSNNPIQKKDLKLIVLSALFSKGLDAIKIGQILDFLK